jgi:hypothetical protein
MTMCSFDVTPGGREKTGSLMFFARVRASDLNDAALCQNGKKSVVLLHAKFMQCPFLDPLCHASCRIFVCPQNLGVPIYLLLLSASSSPSMLPCRAATYPPTLPCPVHHKLRQHSSTPRLTKDSFLCIYQAGLPARQRQTQNGSISGHVLFKDGGSHSGGGPCSS